MLTTLEWAQSLGVSTTDNPAPILNTSARFRRGAPEIAVRVLLVQSVVAAAFGVPPAPIVAWLDRQRIANDLTPRERVFLTSAASRSEEACRSLQWQQEAEWTLLWAIGRVDALGLPVKGCDTKCLVDELLPALGSSIKPFVAAARLRPRSMLAAEDDRTYTLWCAAAAASRNRLPLPPDLNHQILYQRRYAFEWLAGKGSWDQVYCDA